MMSGFSLFLLVAGMLVSLFLVWTAFAGPSSSRQQAKRLEGVRERHSRSSEVAAQAQMKRIFANRQAKGMDGLAQRLIPNPAVLRKRLERTGRSWTPGQYAMVSVGLITIIIMLMMFKGMPALLAVPVGTAVGLGLPHFVISKLIQRRINKFTSRFPDAIELMVRGLRSGLPISETVGIVANEIHEPVKTEFRNVSDKMKIGRTMEAALQETSDRLGTPEFQFFVISLAIQRETGGNLAEILDNLANVVIMAGGGGLVWMSIGAFIMSKMINFEI
jgi:tight adherence protein B